MLAEELKSPTQRFAKTLGPFLLLVGRASLTRSLQKQQGAATSGPLALAPVVHRLHLAGQAARPRRTSVADPCHGRPPARLTLRHGIVAAAGEPARLPPALVAGQLASATLDGQDAALETNLMTPQQRV